MPAGQPTIASQPVALPFCSRGWLPGLALAGVVGAAATLGALFAQPQGAVAQGGGAATSPAVSRVATVDIFAVVERVWLSDANMAARTALAETTNKELETLNGKMQDLRFRATTMGKDSPEIQPISEEFAKVQQEAQQKQQQGNTEMERVSTLQLGEAYQIVMVEANKLAAELGYTHVLASKIGDLTFRSNTMNGALQELLARPVVVSSPADDILSLIHI